MYVMSVEYGKGLKSSLAFDPAAQVLELADVYLRVELYPPQLN